MNKCAQKMMHLEWKIPDHIMTWVSHHLLYICHNLASQFLWQFIDILNFREDFWLTILHVCFEHCLITAVSFLLWDVNIFCIFDERLQNELKQYKNERILRWKKALSWSQGLKMWKSAQSLGKTQNTLILPSVSTLTEKLVAPNYLLSISICWMFVKR